jgi:hypothetical protein
MTRSRVYFRVGARGSNQGITIKLYQIVLAYVFLGSFQYFGYEKCQDHFRYSLTSNTWGQPVFVPPTVVATFHIYGLDNDILAFGNFET